MSFGSGALSNPFIVDLSTEFEKVAIYNNRPGPDAEVLARFHEQSWNNPVVRFLGADQKDLCPKIADDWSEKTLFLRMITALEKSKRPLPAWLPLVAAEFAPKRARVTFDFWCYWAGEASLGKEPGVLQTAIGSLDGQEAVEVEYDPTKTSFESLVRAAMKVDCLEGVFVTTADEATRAESLVAAKPAVRIRKSTARLATDTAQKHDLRAQKALSALPMTEAQASRLNAAVAAGEDTSPFLSPAQRTLLKNQKPAATASTDRSFTAISRALARAATPRR